MNSCQLAVICLLTLRISIVQTPARFLYFVPHRDAGCFDIEVHKKSSNCMQKRKKSVCEKEKKRERERKRASERQRDRKLISNLI